MKLTIKERADSHGSRISHILDVKEGLKRIEFDTLRKSVELTYTTRSDSDVVFLCGDLETIQIDSYSI